MKLVVDTNILISFFRNNPVRFIMINSQMLNLELYFPEHCWKELLGIKSSISKYSKLPSGQIDSIFEELKDIFMIVPDEFSKEFESGAKKLIHGKDIPVFALALKLNCPIWSNEPGFKKQSSVEIFNTRALRELINA